MKSAAALYAATPWQNIEVVIMRKSSAGVKRVGRGLRWEVRWGTMGGKKSGARVFFIR